MGILLVYDVTDDASFNNIRNWMKNIEAHAEDGVVKVCSCASPCRLHTLTIVQHDIHLATTSVSISRRHVTYTVNLSINIYAN